MAALCKGLSGQSSREGFRRAFFRISKTLIQYPHRLQTGQATFESPKGKPNAFLEPGAREIVA